MRRILLLTLWFGAFLFAAISPPGHLQAIAAGEISLSVQPYFGGYYKYGEWLPLRVLVSNAGGDVEAEVRAVIASEGVNTTYAVPVSLPAGARKEITLYTLLPSFARSVTVDLVVDGEEVARDRVVVSGLRNVTYIAGVIAPDAEPYGLLKGVDLGTANRQVVVVPISLRDLPERAEPLRTFDMLVIADTDTSQMSPAQAEALTTWVSGGGRLVLAGGPGAERTLAGLPDVLRPAIAARAVLDGTRALAEFARTETAWISGEFVAAIPAPSCGRALAQQDGQALICERRLGEGWVTYLAFDPAMHPFNAWAGMRTVWSVLLSPGAAYPENRPPDISETQMLAQRLAYTLTNLPSLDLPSVRWLAVLLGIYIVLVGPFNYLLLRRARRLDWAWLTIPGLTLVFAGITFGLGYRLRGGELVVNQISIVERIGPEASASVRSYVGIFSPTRRAYDILVAGEVLASPLAGEPTRWGGPGMGPFGATSMTFVQGDPTIVRGLQINQWAMQGFQVERYDPPGRWGLRADVSYEEGRLSGVVHNDTPYDLTYLVVVIGRRFARLGDVPAGEQMRVDAELKGSDFGPGLPYALFEDAFRNPGPGGVPREAMWKQNILGAAFDGMGRGATLSAGVLLLGWSRESPVDVSVADVQATWVGTTLVLSSVPLNLEAKEVWLPPGVIQPRLVKTQGPAGECGPNGQVFLNPGSEAVLEYQVPLELMDARITELTLSIWAPDPMAGRPSSALYDWGEGAWMELEGGQAKEISVLDPKRFIGPRSGVVRLRLRSEGEGGGCWLYDLGLKAVREP